jgi:hypothetical protein
MMTTRKKFTVLALIAGAGVAWWIMDYANQMKELAAIQVCSQPDSARVSRMCFLRIEATGLRVPLADVEATLAKIEREKAASELRAELEVEAREAQREQVVAVQQGTGELKELTPNGLAHAVGALVAACAANADCIRPYFGSQCVTPPPDVHPAPCDQAAAAWKNHPNQEASNVRAKRQEQPAR